LKFLVSFKESKVIGGQLTPPSPLFSTCIRSNFRDCHLVKNSQIALQPWLWGWQNPKSLGGRVVSDASSAHQALIEWVVVEIPEDDHSIES